MIISYQIYNLHGSHALHRKHAWKWYKYWLLSQLFAKSNSKTFSSKLKTLPNSKFERTRWTWNKGNQKMEIRFKSSQKGKEVIISSLRINLTNKSFKCDPMMTKWIQIGFWYPLRSLVNFFILMFSFNFKTVWKFKEPTRNSRKLGKYSLTSHNK